MPPKLVQKWIGTGKTRKTLAQAAHAGSRREEDGEEGSDTDGGEAAGDQVGIGEETVVEVNEEVEEEEEEVEEDERGVEEEEVAPETPTAKPKPKPKPKPTSVSSGKPSASKPTPMGTPQSKKRPPPWGLSGPGKKPKAKPETIDLDVSSAGEGPSSAAAGPPPPQISVEDCVIIGSFRTRDDNDNKIWSTTHQVKASFADGIPKIDKLRIEPLPWRITNNPNDFGLFPKRRGKPEQPGPIPQVKWRFLNLRNFYNDYAKSHDVFHPFKLFEIIKAELELDWYTRH